LVAFLADVRAFLAGAFPVAFLLAFLTVVSTALGAAFLGAPFFSVVGLAAA